MKLSKVCDIFDQYCEGFSVSLKTNNGYSGAPEGTQSGDGPPSPDDDNNLCCGELPPPPPAPPIPRLVTNQPYPRPLLSSGAPPLCPL
jgi:hypothetical protein